MVELLDYLKWLLCPRMFSVYYAQFPSYSILIISFKKYSWMLFKMHRLKYVVHLYLAPMVGQRQTIIQTHHSSSVKLHGGVTSHLSLKNEQKHILLSAADTVEWAKSPMTYAKCELLQRESFAELTVSLGRDAKLWFLHFMLSEGMEKTVFFFLRKRIQPLNPLTVFSFPSH